jgi:hypothetical protein
MIFMTCTALAAVFDMRHAFSASEWNFCAHFLGPVFGLSFLGPVPVLGPFSLTGALARKKLLAERPLDCGKTACPVHGCSYKANFEVVNTTGAPWAWP